MPTTWILIADGARARVLSQAKDFAPLEPALGDETFTGTTARSKEIASDRPGRSFDPPHRWSRRPIRSATQFEFARELAETLEKAAGARRFERLVLVAAPQTLGDLRDLLPKAVQGRIVAEIDKDLTKVPRQELGKHLGEVLKLQR